MPLLEEKNRLRVKEAIRKAERITSGEIRVCVEKHCNEAVLDRAAYFFKELEMHQTAARNGVLIYLATEDHKFAIIGDAGIHAKVHDEFWDGTRDVMLQYFKNKQLVEGVIKGIEMAGNALAKYFPWERNDKNELADDIYIGDE